MKLQFKDVAGKYIDGKLVYDLTIQDLDGEIAEGRELPFSYVFGQEPTSILESYINDHIDELKAIEIPDSFDSNLDPGCCGSDDSDDSDDVDEFTKFFDAAQEKIQEINKEKNNILEGFISIITGSPLLFTIFLSVQYLLIYITKSDKFSSTDFNV